MSRFNIYSHVYWGSDRYSNLTNFLKGLDVSRVQFVIDSALQGHQVLNSLRALVEEVGGFVVPDIIVEVKGEPTYQQLGI